MIVHGRATSSNVQGVMWTTALLGLDVERRDVGGRFGGTGTPEYRAMNPMGLVPVLEDGDLALFESAAIVRHLVRVHGSAETLTLTPLADSWAEWAKTTFCRAFTVPVFWSFFRTPPERRDMDAVLADLAVFEDLAAVAMAKRGGAPWLLGDRLTIADVWAGNPLYRYFTLDLPRQPPAGLADYYARLSDLPSYREHVMVDYSELEGRLSF